MNKRLISKLALSLAAACALGLALWTPQVRAAVTTDDLRVGDKAPDFTLKDLDDKEYKLSTVVAEDKVVVLEWFNPDCPFVKKHHLHNKTMAKTYKMFEDKDVVWLAINSGAPGKQGSGVERNRRAKEEYKIKYPILLDESGKVGRLYGAKRTPHMVVIDRDRTVVYQGAIDDSPSPKRLGETNYVQAALTQHLAGETIEHTQTKAYGCTIKYAK